MEQVPLDEEAIILEDMRSHLADLRDALGAEAGDVLRVGGDGNTPFWQETTGEVVVVPE